MDLFEYAASKDFDPKSEKYIRGKEEFDLGCGHIAALIEDAFLLFKSKSYSTSLFLSITIIEETSKTNFGMFYSGKTPEHQQRNIFTNHKDKHFLAALPTVLMGKRIKEAIDEKTLNNIFNKLKNGNLVQLREKALYCDRENSKYKSPRDLIGEREAKNMLLLAIEIFDDALDGYTEYSSQLCKRADQIFEELLIS